MPGVNVVTTTSGDAGQFFNVSGRPYDPATVVAIVDNSNVNAGRQSIRGIDFLADYVTDLGTEGRVAKHRVQRQLSEK